MDDIPCGDMPGRLAGGCDCDTATPSTTSQLYSSTFRDMTSPDQASHTTSSPESYSVDERNTINSLNQSWAPTTR